MDFANITTVISTKKNDENAQIHHRRTSNHNSNQNTKLKRSPIIMNRMKKLNNHNDSSNNYDEGSSHESKESNVPRTTPSCLSPISILTHLAFGVVTFHIGFAMGGNYGHSFTVSNLENHMSDISNRNDAHHITQMYHQLLSHLFPSTGTTITGIWNDPNDRIQSDTKNTTITPIFPKTLSKVFYGASTVRRENFIQQFDIGVPWNEPKPDATDVLVMYQSAESLPSDYYEKDASSRPNVHSSTAAADGDGGHPTPMSPIRVSYDSADEATTNCHSMKVILIEPNTKHECVALVPQWESFHVQHFLRILPENMTSSRNKNPKPPHFQANYPLRIVSRHDTLSGKTKPRIPIAYQNKKYWLMLLDYLSKLSATLERLKPLAETVVTSSNNFHRSKTIVVMVCNFGQSELFMNFVCSARARNIDVSNILLFATDQDMYRLAQSLHITTFEVQDAFGEMPTGAAKVYGDRVFQGMMLSKVYCVHLISALGYDVLFQDVDVVWYRNPIEYFQSKQSGDFDFYFQDGTYNQRQRVDNMHSVTFHISHPMIHLLLSYDVKMVHIQHDIHLTHRIRDFIMYVTMNGLDIFSKSL